MRPPRAPSLFRAFSLLALCSVTTGLPAQTSPQASPRTLDQLPPELRRSLREAVIESSYGVLRTSRALEAQNPAQGMRSTFSADGVHVAGVDSARGPWSLFLELEAWGSGDELHPLAAAEPVAPPVGPGQRIEYRRGPVVEWYQNEARGLEQGFTVEVPPPGADGR